MTDQEKRHVFISYVRENQNQVDRLCQDLESYGVTVWLDRNDIKPGARWKSAIQEAIRNGNFFIACFSDEYTSKTKTYMNEELTLAIEELRQYASDREWFIPVLLSECDIPARSIGAGETLLDINWVPLFEDWKAGIKKIVSVIKPIHPEIQKLVSALCSGDSGVRERAAKVIVNIGPETIPALIEVLKHNNLRIGAGAAVALGRIGPVAIPALKEALKVKNKHGRAMAALALSEIGPEAKTAVPAVIKALKDKDDYVRQQAAGALGSIGPKTKEVVQALIKVANHKDKQVRRTAIWALSVNICPEINKAIPVVIATCKDESSMVRRAAVNLLGKIGTDAKTVVSALTEALKDENEKVRKDAAGILEKINRNEAQKKHSKDI